MTYNLKDFSACPKLTYRVEYMDCDDETLEFTMNTYTEEFDSTSALHKFIQQPRESIFFRIIKVEEIRTFVPDNI